MTDMREPDNDWIDYQEQLQEIEAANMQTTLAYQVSYITEYRDGRSIETHDDQTRFFATREQAVAHAQHLTGSARDNNGVFVGEWVTPFAGIVVDEFDAIRVIAIVETVTLDEIEESL
jgi:hypothetical protein